MDFLKYLIKCFLIGALGMFFWCAKTPTVYAQAEFACMEHKGVSWNFAETVYCNDGFRQEGYQKVGNEWIYNRKIEISNKSIIDHLYYIFEH